MCWAVGVDSEVKKGGLCDFLFLWILFNGWMVNLDESDRMCTLSNVVTPAKPRGSSFPAASPV